MHPGLLNIPRLFSASVGISVLDDGMDPMNDLVEALDARPLIDSVLQGQRQLVLWDGWVRLTAAKLPSLGPAAKR